MGRGGYLGGSTIIKFSGLSKGRKKPKATVPEDYDFEERAEGIRKALQIRKEKISKGEEFHLIPEGKISVRKSKKKRKARNKK